MLYFGFCFVLFFVFFFVFVFVFLLPLVFMMVFSFGVWELDSVFVFRSSSISRSFYYYLTPLLIGVSDQPCTELCIKFKNYTLWIFALRTVRINHCDSSILFLILGKLCVMYHLSHPIRAAHDIYAADMWEKELLAIHIWKSVKLPAQL